MASTLPLDFSLTRRPPWSPEAPNTTLANTPIAKADRLYNETPRPQRGPVARRLDMIRMSSNAFERLLETTVSFTLRRRSCRSFLFGLLLFLVVGWLFDLGLYELPGDRLAHDGLNLVK
jgi:hypothetical protein